MLSQQIIDTEMYLEFLPDGYIPNRDEIIKGIKERKAMMQQMPVAPNGAPVQAQPMQELAQAIGAPVMS